jgi:putative redox protein
MMGESTVEIRAAWQGGLTFEGSDSTGATIRMASPPSGESGASPMEILLMALAGCTGMDVISILEKKRQPAKSLEIRIRGMRTEEHPRVYTDIELEFILRGEALTPEAVARAIELSEKKYCSVGGMLAKSARIHSTFQIIPPGEDAHG